MNASIRIKKIRTTTRMNFYISNWFLFIGFSCSTCLFYVFTSASSIVWGFLCLAGLFNYCSLGLATLSGGVCTIEGGVYLGDYVGFGLSIYKGDLYLFKGLLSLGIVFFIGLSFPLRTFLVLMWAFYRKLVQPECNCTICSNILV